MSKLACQILLCFQQDGHLTSFFPEELFYEILRIVGFLWSYSIRYPDTKSLLHIYLSALQLTPPCPDSFSPTGMYSTALQMIHIKAIIHNYSSFHCANKHDDCIFIRKRGVHRRPFRRGRPSSCDLKPTSKLPND